MNMNRVLGSDLKIQKYDEVVNRAIIGLRTRLLGGRRVEASWLLVVEFSTVVRRNKRVSHCQAGRVSCSHPSRRARDHGESRASWWILGTTATVRMSLITRDDVATALRRKTLVWEDSGCRNLWKTGNWSSRKWILHRTLQTCVPKCCLGTEFASCIGWLGVRMPQWRRHGWRSRRMVSESSVWVVPRWEIRTESSDAESEGRVGFTCLICFSQTDFASAVGHELVDPQRRTRSFMGKGFMWTAVRHISIQLSFLRKSECFKYALVISVFFFLTQVPNRYCCAPGVLHKCADFFFFLSYHTVVVCLCAHPQHRVTDSSDRFTVQGTKQCVHIHHISSTW